MADKLALVGFSMMLFMASCFTWLMQYLMLCASLLLHNCLVNAHFE